MFQNTFWGQIPFGAGQIPCTWNQVPMGVNTLGNNFGSHFGYNTGLQGYNPTIQGFAGTNCYPQFGGYTMPVGQGFVPTLNNGQVPFGTNLGGNQPLNTNVPMNSGVPFGNLPFNTMNSGVPFGNLPFNTMNSGVPFNNLPYTGSFFGYGVNTNTGVGQGFNPYAGLGNCFNPFLNCR